MNSSLFAHAFNDNGEVLFGVAERCCNIADISHHMGSDLSIIVDVMKLMVSAPDSLLGVANRQRLFDRHQTLISPILFDGWIQIADFKALIRMPDEKVRNIFLIRLSQLKTQCIHDVHSALVVTMILGIISGLPSNTHKTCSCDEDFKTKIHRFNATAKHVKSSWQKVPLLKALIRKVSTIEYCHEGWCSVDFVNTILTFVNVHILINILQHDRVLEHDLSRVVYDSQTSILNELIRSLKVA